MSASQAPLLLASLVGFETTSALSNLPAIAWIEAHLDRHGVGYERVPNADGTKANLLATIGPREVPGYLLSGHVDCVPVTGEAWGTDPFRLTDTGSGRLAGRGTSDMKGFLAAVLAMVPEMTAAPLARPIHIAVSYDEEVGCVGVRDLIARVAATLPPPEACFVGEPTGMAVVIGHKGKRAERATFTGLAAHSSLAPRGVNAIHAAARLTGRVAALAERLALRGSRDELYDVAHSTAQVSRIDGGIALNIVPDRCTLEFEVRTLAADDPDALCEEIIAFARAEIEPGLRERDPRAGVGFETILAYPGLNVAEDAPEATLAKALAGRNGVAKVAFGTEAGLYAAAGMPAIVVGPGDIARAHKADEWIGRDELDQACAFIARLLDRCRA